MNGFKPLALRWLCTSLPKADIDVPAPKYLDAVLRYAVLLSVFFWLFWSLVFSDFFGGIRATIVFFGACIGGGFYYPVLKKNTKAQLVEKELAFAFLNLSIELGVENRFEHAIKNVCEKNPNVLGRELQVALAQVSEGGVSLQQALLNTALRVDSQSFKRAVMKLITVYEQGGSRHIRCEAIRSIAREELAVQRAKSREFSQKLVLYSVMFVVVSAVFPALFQAFIIAGSAFMSLDFSPLQVVLIVTVVFPAIDLGALFFIRAKTPLFLR